MDYTPRQLQAFVFLAGKRRQRELGELLHVNTLGSRGDEKTIRATLRSWEE
jgi:hypothetical protein